MNISTLDIDELGKGRIVPDFKHLPFYAPIIWMTREEVGEMYPASKVRQLHENETYH